MLRLERRNKVEGRMIDLAGDTRFEAADSVDFV
jgi:hypothetical protein